MVDLLVASTLTISVLALAPRGQPGLATRTFAGTPLPAGVALLPGGPARDTDISAVDGGMPTLIALDRRDGFASSMTQDYRDGVRHLRLEAKTYHSPTGAAHAYARAVGFLHRILPDPVLRARIATLTGVGSAATIATYSSALGRFHYTATALVAHEGTTVCEAQGFPQGTNDGTPARDTRDLPALALRCLGQGSTMGN
jgi:hypothetical protein